MQELANHIWSNGRFHIAAARAHRTWLARELGKSLEDEVTLDDAVRLMQAAAVLAAPRTQNTAGKPTARRP
jgi:hypothetical protein